jgi:hypothetical protein
MVIRTVRDNSPKAEERRTLLQTAESLIKFSALYAAFGYISLRAHVNSLGLSTSAGFDVQRYLMEAYLLSVFILVPMFIAFALIAALLTLFWTIWHVAEHYNAVPPSIRMLSAKIQELPTFFWFAAVSVCLLLVTFAGALKTMLVWLSRQNVIIGTLSGRDLAWPDHTGLFFLLCVICALCYSLSTRVRKHFIQKTRVSKSVQNLWGVFAFVLFGLVAMVPILFGLGIHPRDYPPVTLTFGESSPQRTLNGYLIAENSSEVELWSRLARITFTPLQLRGRERIC